MANITQIPVSPVRASALSRGPLASLASIRPLRHPAFLRIWFSSIFTYPARVAEVTTLAWLVVERTDSPFAVGLLSFFRFTPFLIAGPVMGVVADRIPRLRVVRISQSSLAILTLAMAALVFSGRLELWHIFAYTSLSGLLWTIEVPARRTYLIGVAGRRGATSAVSLDMLAWTIGTLAGSNLAGIVLRFVDAGYVFVAVSSQYLLSMWLMRRLPRLWRTRQSAREPFTRSLFEAVRYARQSRALIAVIAVVAVQNLFGFTHEALAPVFAKDVLGTGPALFGLLLSAPAIGSIVTTVMISAAGPRLRYHGRLLLAASALLGGLGIAFAFSRWYAVSFGVFLMIGVVGGAFSVMHSSLYLILTPDTMRGRMLGLQAFVIGAYPISSLVVGAIAAALTPTLAVTIMATACLVALGVIFLAFPEMRLPTDSLPRGRSAALADSELRRETRPEPR
ncbi:MAG: MFS transporter [Chloroflexi bacterium]|nr:MFS transporter [Chloroflexota bacterium]